MEDHIAEFMLKAHLGQLRFMYLPGCWVNLWRQPRLTPDTWHGCVVSVGPSHAGRWQSAVRLCGAGPAPAPLQD